MFRSILFTLLILYGDYKKDKLGFGLYDFSNSGFIIIFQSLLFPVVLTAAASGRFGNPDSVWAWLVAGSSLMAVLAAPFIGVLADSRGRSKVFTFLVVAAGILAAIVTWLFVGSVWGLVVGFLVFNTLFELSQSVYDSFLRRFSTNIKESTSLSSFGWGIGYLGSALFAALYFVGEKVELSHHLALFGFALLFVVLSYPAMRYFAKRDSEVGPTEIRSAEIHRPRPPIPWTQLLIYWIISDCVAAILYFVPLYAQREIGVGTSTTGALMLAALILAFPLTVLVGKLSNRIGHVKTIRIGLVLWCFVLLGLLVAHSIIPLVLVMIPFAFVVGSTQAIMRAHFASRIERESSSEGFGFYAIAQKSASILSPLLVGLVITMTGVMRPAFAVLIALVVIAFFASFKLPESQTPSESQKV